MLHKTLHSELLHSTMHILNIQSCLLVMQLGVQKCNLNLLIPQQNPLTQSHSTLNIDVFTENI
jgi:hypothetical protein